MNIPTTEITGIPWLRLLFLRRGWKQTAVCLRCLSVCLLSFPSNPHPPASLAPTPLSPAARSVSIAVFRRSICWKLFDTRTWFFLSLFSFSSFFFFPTSFLSTWINRYEGVESRMMKYVTNFGRFVLCNQVWRDSLMQQLNRGCVRIDATWGVSRLNIESWMSRENESFGRRNVQVVLQLCDWQWVSRVELKLGCERRVLGRLKLWASWECPA